MNKVVTVNLNGNAYQVDDAAFDALRAYLDKAQTELARNPDCGEIVTDLEQAIADKCDTFLGANKNVISTKEMAQILMEMGPAGVSQSDGTATASTAPTAAPAAPTRRLFRLPEQGMLGGVCAGIAAYFNIDVVWARLAFVVLTLFTGVWFFVWLVMLFVMPRAVTPEDIALAHGNPFNAQDVINRAKKKYDEYSAAAAELGRREWARHESTVSNTTADLKKGFENLGAKLRRTGNDVPHRRSHRPPRSDVQVSYGAQVLAGFALPVLSVLSASALVAVLVLMLLLADNNSVIGWLPELGAPQWLLFAAAGIAYLIVAAPLRRPPLWAGDRLG
jgi:phage shock protein PspC (stress-responsive transcriptional regulator)